MKRQEQRARDHDATGILRQTAVSHIGFRVPNVTETADFYSRILGLVVHQALPDGGLRLGWGSGHHVLDLLPGESALDHYAFEVRDADAIDGMRTRLERFGAPTEDVPVEYLDEAIGSIESVQSVDPDGNTIQFHSAVMRDGEVTGQTSRRPVRYQHVTIGTVDVAAMAAFFSTILGFRISDRLEDGSFTWLRSDKDHHTLAVVDVGRRGHVDHYSYDLAEWEDFKAWCDRLTDQDVAVQWGPGRHGPGNNLFVFFDDPAGNHVELSAEMEKFYDDRVTYVPRLWKPRPDTVNLWGGQLPSWRNTGR